MNKVQYIDWIKDLNYWYFAIRTSLPKLFQKIYVNLKFSARILKYLNNQEFKTSILLFIWFSEDYRDSVVVNK